jgi:DHA2 family multidrug resistance protein-like MFS transporter
MLLEFFWWGSVFLIGVPVMALLLILGPRTLPEYRDANARRLDLISAVMSLLAILAVVYGLKQIAQDGIAPVPLLAIVAGAVLGVVFVRRQLRLESPVIDVRLFRIRAFSASLGTYFLGIFVVIGYFLFISQYLQLVVGLTPFVAALWSLPSAAGFIVGSTIAPKVIHRVRPSMVMGTGMAVAAVGTAMLVGLSAAGGIANLVLIAAASVVISVGLAPVITLATELIVGSAPPEQAGAATGISETSGELGGALGIAILGSIGTAVYRSEVADRLPSDIPAGVADAVRDTLGGAVAIAQALPGELGAALVAVAQGAFVDALRFVAAVAAAGAVVAAIGAALALRGVAARSEPDAEEPDAEPIRAPDSTLT